LRVLKEVSMALVIDWVVDCEDVEKMSAFCVGGAGSGAHLYRSA